MNTIIDMPPETSEKPPRIRSPKLSNRQMRAILSAILAGAVTDKPPPANAGAIVETYHAIYKELQDKGIRPKA